MQEKEQILSDRRRGKKNKSKMFAQPWSGAAPAASAVSSANSNGIQAAD